MAGTHLVDEHPRPGPAAGRRGGGEQSWTKSAIAGSASAPTAIIVTNQRLPGWAPRNSGAPPKALIIRRAATDLPADQQGRHPQQVDLLEQVSGGGVDQGDRIGALGDAVPMTIGPRTDRDAAHRVSGDDRALPRPQRGRQHGVQVGGQMVQAVARPVRNPAAAVAPVVVGDHAEVPGKVVDLLMPDADVRR